MTTTSSSWVLEKKKLQDKWKKKSNSYKTLIDKMLFSGGDFVGIPSKGESLINLLARTAKRFKSLAKKTTSTGGNGKAALLKLVEKNGKRYRLCIGYCLVIEGNMSFWIRHYWVYDTTIKMILEATILKPRYYFGIILSEAGAAKLVEKSKGNS